MFELVPNVTVEVETFDGKLTTVSDGEGKFSIKVPAESLSVKFSGGNIEPVARIFAPNEKLENIDIKVAFVVPPVNETVTIQADTLAPDIETRNDTIYKNFLLNRDDQLIQGLNAGINAGQHEGGGKSLEIRRFGFNTDHGGIGGGVKILVDNIQQNQSTQAHGQGYLGSLKSLSSELVEDVSVINGPFSAAYGDFSGLGVVQIRQKETLPQQFTARIQAGSFNTFRTFLAYSPRIGNVDSFAAYELSKTDGPFENPLKYRRDNVTGNFTYKFSDRQIFGLKLNFGRSDFTSSGQIPLDEVARGNLDRFGFLDRDNGGKVRQGTIGVYFRKEFKSGATFKADAFVGRSLFDLWSNFTFFLSDPVYGDEIQQHDSRLQEGANVQYLQPYKFFGRQALLTVGGNFLAGQINVGLYPSIARSPRRKFFPENINNPNVLLTSAQANVNNFAAYAQNGIDFFNGHLRIEAGLRFDYFTFDVDGFEIGGKTFSPSASRHRDTEIFKEKLTGITGWTGINTNFLKSLLIPVIPVNFPLCLCASVVNPLVGKESAGAFQPKLALAWSPFEKFPVSFYANYGRGISSQDARGIVRNPDAPKISTTDFYQIGASYNSNRFFAVFSSFFIDRSNEQIYIPDDGSVEFTGRSRSYGFEIKTSAKLTRNLSFNGGLTQVLKAFYPGEFTADNRRIIVDSAPKTTANASLILSEFYGFNSSLGWRSISSYRLDGVDASIRAAGNDVVDFAVSKRLKKWVDFNVSIDNLLNKRYYETQNYFESRICPTCDTVSRIHATPAYPFTINFGLTFRLWAKE